MLGFVALATAPLADDVRKINYEFSANEVTAGIPAVDSVNAFITTPCTADDITTTPVVDAISVSHIYNFAATEITTGAVLVDIVTMYEDETIIPADTISSNPTIDQIDVSVTSNLTADSISATPVVDSIPVSVTSNLTATEITSAAPTVDDLSISHVYNFAGDEISTSAPSVDSIAVSVISNFAPISISTIPVVDALTFFQRHNLLANEITAGIPTLPARFLWDFQELVSETWSEIDESALSWAAQDETSETWSNISDINTVWSEQSETQETWSSAA
jgi:hypothetical protein